MKFRLTNRKMILFHNILNANDWQLCKKVAEEQERFDIENGWYKEILRKDGEIKMHVRKAKEYSIEEWNKTV